MSKTVLLNTRIFASGADLTGVSSKVELGCEVEDKDVTAFRDVDDDDAGWMELLGGLGSTTINASGQWEAGDAGKVDDSQWSALTGRAPVPWTICPVSAAVGSLAYFTAGLATSYKLLGQVGDVAPWEAEASGSGLPTRGQVAHPPGTARTADGTGTALNLGAVAAGQKLRAALHVLSVAGTGSPSITVSVESAASEDAEDDDWTTRATFTAAASRTAEVVTAAGAITDTWWRLAWDVSGTSPSFLFAGAVGIA